jgi:hypothetical protein
VSSLPNEQSPSESAANYCGLHGNTGEKLILPDEKPANFASLLAGLLTEYQPETLQHQLFVEQLAIGHWMLWRRERAYHAVEFLVYTNSGDTTASWTEWDLRRLFVTERYKVSAERALKRALDNAESIRKGRKSQQDHLERHAKWLAEQQLRERRQQLQEQKQKAAEAKKKAPDVPAAEPAEPGSVAKLKHLPSEVLANQTPPAEKS